MPRHQGDPGSRIRSGTSPQSPVENAPLLREIAIGHRDPGVRWRCVCALASRPADAADALTLLLRESADSAVRHRAGRALRPVTVVLGALVMTSTAFSALHRDDVKQALLRRHALGDWGDLCREDWEANEHALFENGRLLSVYHDRVSHDPPEVREDRRAAPATGHEPSATGPDSKRVLWAEPAEIMDTH